MLTMYCPKCGRELEMDTGEVRFCRYCGFELQETKEALHGYTKIKRQGLNFAVWAYNLLVLGFILQLFDWADTKTVWGTVVLITLMALSGGFFVAGVLSVEITKYTKRGQRAKETDAQRERAIESPADSTSKRGETLPPAQSIPITTLNEQGAKTAEVVRPPSVTENTTRQLAGSRSSE